jgi:ribosome-associated toxin RatA of RatAB toxin-antitoxin module
MKTSNRIQISGSYERLFSLAADIARWPEILPHYRWVKILEKNQKGIIAEMAARHIGWPLWWKTIQRTRPEAARIEFTHIGGITKGMEVAWTFEQVGESCLGPTWLVQIHHEFSPRWLPGVGPLFAKYIVGDLFVKQVAQKTLTQMKRLTEAAS